LQEVFLSKDKYGFVFLENNFISSFVTNFNIRERNVSPGWFLSSPQPND